MIELRDRILPLFSACVLYSALYFNIRHTGQIPQALTSAMLGILVGCFMSLFVINFQRISVHAVGMASIVTSLFMYYYQYSAYPINVYYGAVDVQIDFIAVPLIFMLISGLLASFRVQRKTNSMNEIWSGWMIGVFSQTVPYMF